MVGARDESCVATFERRRPSATAAWLFIAGGFAVETVDASAAVLLLTSLGLGEMARVWAWSSSLLNAIYLAFNAVVSVCRGHTYGDAASLWQIRIGGTIAFLLAAAATKAAAIVLAS